MKNEVYAYPLLRENIIPSNCGKNKLKGTSLLCIWYKNILCNVWISPTNQWRLNEISSVFQI